jgi:hypothetical protein
MSSLNPILPLEDTNVLSTKVEHASSPNGNFQYSVIELGIQGPPSNDLGGIADLCWDSMGNRYVKLSNTAGMPNWTLWDGETFGKRTVSWHPADVEPGAERITGERRFRIDGYSFKWRTLSSLKSEKHKEQKNEGGKQNKSAKRKARDEEGDLLPDQELHVGKKPKVDDDLIPLPSTSERLLHKPSVSSTIPLDCTRSTPAPGHLLISPPLPKPACEDNSWILDLLEMTYRSLTRHPNLVQFEQILTALLQFPNPIPIFNNFIDYSEYQDDAKVPRYSRRHAGRDFLQYMFKGMINAADVVRGTMGQVASEEVIVMLSQMDADYCEENHLPCTAVINIPMSKEGGLSCKLQIPKSIRSSTIVNKVEGGIDDWGLTWTPAGSMTPGHFDYEGNVQPMLSAGECDKLWLIWPATKANLAYWKQHKFRTPTPTYTLDMIKQMEDMKIIRQKGENQHFILPTCHFHAVLTFKFSTHIGCMAYDARDWEITKGYIAWNLNFLEEMGAEFQQECQEELTDLEKSLEFWKQLGERLTGSDSMPQTKGKRKADRKGKGKEIALDSLGTGVEENSTLRDIGEVILKDLKGIKQNIKDLKKRRPDFI